jgi:hypothetical protein
LHVLPALGEEPPLGDQRGAPVEVGRGHHPLHVLQREAELAEEEDLLEARQVVVGVEAVAGVRAPRGGEQADGVVVMEGPHADAREPGDLADGVSHARVVRPHAA